MSTPGGAPERVPSTVKVGKTTGAGKPPEGEPGGAKPTNAARASGAKSTGAKAAGKGSRPQTKSGGGGGKGRKPVKAVKMNGGRSWGPIAVIAAVALIAVGIIGWGAYAVSQGAKPWEERAAAIKGIVNYRENPDKTLTATAHKAGPLPYKVIPPVGGEHNAAWQNCMGNVYDAPIANEHAVHSLEHGAVWVAYKQGMPADQVEKLREKVTGQGFMMMSPVAGLPTNISLQAWGYQLKLDSADDGRIDEFIRALRQVASIEPGIPCSGGVTQTGTTPVDGAPAGQ